MTFLERVTNQYRERAAQASGPEAAFRARAWAEFEKHGLPKRQDEAWRYSSITSLTGTPWTAADQVATPKRALELRDQWRETFDVLVMVNGELRLHDSVASKPLANAVSAARFDDDVTFGDGFASLSAALSRAGVRFELGANVSLPKPVLIINAQAGAAAWASVYNQIVLGPNAAAELAVIYVGDESSDSASYLRTEVTQVRLSAGARLDWLRMQQDGAKARHFAEAHARLDRDASLTVTQINAGAAWSRSIVRADIEGTGAGARIFGLTFGRDQQHVDQRIVVNHAVGHSNSTQLFKGVLRDRAKGILNGKILIAQDAQKVSSAQYNHNLLLSPGAEANTQPELEIYADDVKANHGASIGRMDEDKIFYLVSRGIPRDQARQMLAQAFVADVLMKTPSARLRELAEARVRGLLPEFV